MIFAIMKQTCYSSHRRADFSCKSLEPFSSMKGQAAFQTKQKENKQADKPSKTWPVDLERSSADNEGWVDTDGPWVVSAVSLHATLWWWWSGCWLCHRWASHTDVGAVAVTSVQHTQQHPLPQRHDDTNNNPADTGLVTVARVIRTCKTCREKGTSCSLMRC